MEAMNMDFPFEQASELMKFPTFHRGTFMPIFATARRTRDGEDTFIR
jgi:hypothetical protein